jgi:hypothetical protein
VKRLRKVAVAAIALVSLSGVWLPGAHAAPATAQSGKNVMCVASLGIGTLKLLPAGICIPALF